MPKPLPKPIRITIRSDVGLPSSFPDRQWMVSLVDTALQCRLTSSPRVITITINSKP